MDLRKAVSVFGGLVLLSVPRASALIDQDGDGMSDIWEYLYEASPGDLMPSEDPDGDGFDNLTESVAGTDPYDAESFLGLDHRLLLEGLELTWNEQSGKIYTLDSSEDLIRWDEVVEFEMADGLFGLPDENPPPPDQIGSDYLDSWHLWKSGFGGLDSLWVNQYGFESNAAEADYGFDDDLDGDQQKNFIESYASTDPGDADSCLEVVLDTARSRVLLDYIGRDGMLRYRIL